MHLGNSASVDVESTLCSWEGLRQLYLRNFSCPRYVEYRNSMFVKECF